MVHITTTYHVHIVEEGNWASEKVGVSNELSEVGTLHHVYERKDILSKLQIWTVSTAQRSRECKPALNLIYASVKQELQVWPRRPIVRQSHLAEESSGVLGCHLATRQSQQQIDLSVCILHCRLPPDMVHMELATWSAPWLPHVHKQWIPGGFWGFFSSGLKLRMIKVGVSCCFCWLTGTKLDANNSTLIVTWRCIWQAHAPINHTLYSRSKISLGWAWVSPTHAKLHCTRSCVCLFAHLFAAT